SLYTSRVAEPLEYHRSFLKDNCRPDGRELSEFRTTTLNIGSITTADGSALVKVGNTTVICGIKAELTNPIVEAPGKGYIVPNVDLPPLCSSRFRPGPPAEQAQAASQFIADVIESSEVIQTEDLCIERGKVNPYIAHTLVLLDCLVIGSDSADSGCITVSLLPTAHLPEVTISTETSKPEVNLEKRHGLHIHRHPVGASFCVFDDSILIVDPTAEEESLSTAQLTVVTDDEDRLCVVHKPGGTSLSGEKLQECISRATARQREIQKLIDKVIHSVKTAQ
uniref:Ribosomal RNA-processing protein 43 n=1 Tax=Sander lucioperca TaxID=283035 RepID=A0A8C9ZU08_SANLU